MFGRGWQGFEGPRERLFEKGDLKYLTLDLLAERPRHGYDIIQALEERSGGSYSPSPGSVYPILQMLEDMGSVVSESRSGRKVYTITESGRQFLAENQVTVRAIWDRLQPSHGPASHADWHEAMHEMRDEFRDLGRVFGRRGWHRQLTPDKIKKVREVIQRARREIESILMD